METQLFLQSAETILAVIGFASIALHAIAPLTKNTIDNKIVGFLDMILKTVSLHKTDKGVNIVINGKK